MDARELNRRVNVVVGTTVSVLSLYVIVRMMFGPDITTRARMRAYLVTSHAAKRGADMMLTVASNADTAYHKARNVVV